MKRIALIVLLVVVLFKTINAQQLSFNLHGGYASTLLANHPTYNQPLDAWNIGVGVGYQFTNHIAAVSELNYELKGAQGTINYYNSVGDKVLSYTKEQQLHYVTLPVMARFFVGAKGIQAFVNAGFYYGFLAKAWVNPQDVGVNHDVTADFNRNDLGIASGLGMLYFINDRYSITLEWRNNYGLTNVSATANNQYNRSNVFQLGLGYHLAGK